MTGSVENQRVTAVRAVDVALASGVAVIATLGTADLAAEPLDALAFGLLAAAGLGLVVHRQWPLAAFAVALAAQLSYRLLGYPEGLDWLPALVALGSVAFALGWRWAVPLVVLCLGLSSLDVADRGLAAVDTESLVILVGLGAATLVGTSLRTRREYLQAVQEHAELLERSRADEARRLVGEERLRIAREVHDVVAHAIASITVQAGAGEHVADRAPERAREALAAIRRTSSTALDDLRSVLGTLRIDGETAPPGGLDDLDRLAAPARAAGLDVRVTVRGERPPLPAAVDRAAYRIVQEAVTNTIKHAGATRLDIAVTFRPSALDVSVADDGSGPRCDADADGHDGSSAARDVHSGHDGSSAARDVHSGHDGSSAARDVHSGHDGSSAARDVHSGHDGSSAARDVHSGHDGSSAARDVHSGHDGSSAARDVHSGHGLLGMRERVDVLGGRLEVGPRDGGGFRVDARLPLRGATR